MKTTSSSNWIVRCANPRCRHVCFENDWIRKPKANPTPIEATLRVKQAHCHKCNSTSFLRATEKEAVKFTETLHEHPENYDGPCLCGTCKSYD